MEAQASAFLATLLVALLGAAPAAGSGWLVHVEVGDAVDAGAGSNPFTGGGDAVDVGVLNAQCSDEEDVVDVGVANDEGNGARTAPATRCDEPAGPCTQEEGGGAEVNGETVLEEDPVPAGAVDRPAGEEASERCTDDGDTADVGVANVEGNPDDRKCHPSFDPANRGDRGDGVDLALLNRECNDRDDAVDLGLVNCEIRDSTDAVDVAVLGYETVDPGDGLDVAVLSTEEGDEDDDRSVDVGPGQGPLCSKADPLLP